jgi:NhaA family Na+:H+ antiporter
MSIFVSSLAFKDELLIANAKLDIMIASVLAAVVGVIMFRVFVPVKENYEVKEERSLAG